MKDFLGQDLAVGDIVVGCVSHMKNSGASLVKFTIEGFTEHFVKGSIPDYRGSTGFYTQKKIEPRKCIKVT